MKQYNLEPWKENKQRLTFTEKTHTYYWDNVEVDRSVTEIIKHLGTVNYDEIDEGILEMAAVKGTMVHRWIEDCFNRVPEFNRKILESHKPYINAFLQWCKDYAERYYIMSSELKMFNPKLEYAGTIDLLLYDSKLDKFGVLDFKTTTTQQDVMVSAQLGAYKNMLEVWNPHQKIEIGYVLYLHKDGKYTFKSSNIDKGEKLFLKSIKRKRNGRK